MKEFVCYLEIRRNQTLKDVVYQGIIALKYHKYQGCKNKNYRRFFVISLQNQKDKRQTIKDSKIMSKTVEIQIEKSLNLIQGLRKHVKEHGENEFTEAAIASLEETLGKLQAANDEVTRLREELAPKVKHMNEVFDAVKGGHQGLKQKLKSLYPQEKWADYGIPDKR